MFTAVHTILAGVTTTDLARPALESLLGELAKVEAHAAERRLAVTAAIDGLDDGGIGGADVTRVKARRSAKSARKAAKTARAAEDATDEGCAGAGRDQRRACRCRGRCGGPGVTGGGRFVGRRCHVAARRPLCEGGSVLGVGAGGRPRRDVRPAPATTKRTPASPRRAAAVSVVSRHHCRTSR